MNYISDHELLLQKSKEGCPESTMLMGFNYYHGIGVLKDINRSLPYFMRFYSFHRSDSKSSLPYDFDYYRFMASFAMHCLDYFYFKESKELFERLLTEGSQVLSRKEIDSISEEYQVLKRLKIIMLIEHNVIQTDYLLN